MRILHSGITPRIRLQTQEVDVIGYETPVLPLLPQLKRLQTKTSGSEDPSEGYETMTTTGSDMSEVFSNSIILLTIYFRTILNFGIPKNFQSKISELLQRILHLLVGSSGQRKVKAWLLLQQQQGSSDSDVQSMKEPDLKMTLVKSWDLEHLQYI